MSNDRYQGGVNRPRATIIGHCDRLGYLRCVTCHEAREVESDRPVWSDSGLLDACDCCGVPLDSRAPETASES